jgi:histidine ammonia-lyase
VEHRERKPAPATAAAIRAVREVVPPLEEDRALSEEIEAVAALIEDGALLRAVEDVVGELA